MKFENSVTIALPVEQAWSLLLDIPRIAPCLPGAELTDIEDDRSFKGRVSVRLGPVALMFSGRATIDGIDDAAHRASIKAQGVDTKGRGGANAVVNFQLVPADGGTLINVETDLALSGFVAQYGRGAGVIREVAAQLLQQFAERLKQKLAHEAAMDGADGGCNVAPDALPAAQPISGLSLLSRSAWSALTKRR